MNKQPERNMNDTPRTNQAVAQSDGQWSFVLRGCSQQLERELAEIRDIAKQFVSILDITEESDGGRLFHPTNITSCRAGDLQKIGELVEALRRASRNQPTPNDI